MKCSHLDGLYILCKDISYISQRLLVLWLVITNEVGVDQLSYSLLVITNAVMIVDPHLMIVRVHTTSIIFKSVLVTFVNYTHSYAFNKEWFHCFS